VFTSRVSLLLDTESFFRVFFGYPVEFRGAQVNVSEILASANNYSPTATAAVVVVVISAFAVVWKALTVVKCAIAQKRNDRD
jgi:hypothetical protein